MLLSVDVLVKRFPGTEHPVLDGVNLSVDAGEAVALTGESGSGKSTLLHIIAGLESFDSGEVAVAGVSLSGLNDAEQAALRREKIGIVFQQFNLIPSLTVGQNVAFQARLAKKPAGPREVGVLAETLGLTDHMSKYPEELSGGQQQRVAIGRAILHQPKLVLADEPTGNLDESTADTIVDALLELCRSSGAGLLLVTHSQRLAARTDRQLHLSHGVLTE